MQVSPKEQKRIYTLPEYKF